MSSLQTEYDVLQALQSVTDPEIPTISVVDLGIVTKVDVSETSLHVVITPTFVGCPATEAIRKNVEERLREFGNKSISVTVDFSTPWNSNRISDKGREALRKHGLSPAPVYQIEFDPSMLHGAECPVCGSTNTKLTSPFGPTLCRALHYCNNCNQAFEQFKPL